MITLKRLKKIEETLATEDLEMSTEELLELTRLACLGLWAEKRGIPTLRAYTEPSLDEDDFEAFVSLAMEALPKERK